MDSTSNKVPVNLYEPEENALYTVYLEPHEAKLCETDMNFAQEVLQDAKMPVRFINQTDDIVGQPVGVEENTNICAENTSQTVGSSEKNDSSWSYNETLALINAYDNYKENFNIVKKRKTVWADISNELLSHGISKSENKCETKWKNLIRTYKNVKDMKKSSGRGSSRFLFFARLDEILGDKPSVSSKHTFSTTKINNLSSDAAETQCEDGRDETNIGSKSGIELNSKNMINEKNQQEENREENQTKNDKKKVRNTLKRKTEELIDIKIHYFKRRQEEKDAKEKRKEEKITLQKRLVDLEEKKVGLLERYVSNPVSNNVSTRCDGNVNTSDNTSDIL